MASSRPSLALCFACRAGDATCKNSVKDGPCCDESCLVVVARRECDLKCGRNESSSCSSDKKSTTSGAPESPLLPTQIRKRKREACSTRSNSVRERYLATLINVGRICKELIARKLEPCCEVARPASTRETTADARKTSSLSALSKKADGIVCARKERCGDDDGTATSKKDECCGSEKTTGYSVLKKDGCCGTEGPGHDFSGTTGTSGCPGESKAGLYNPELEHVGAKNGDRIIVDKKSHCSVIAELGCSGSAKKDHSCDFKKVRFGEKLKKCCCQIAPCSDKSDCSEGTNILPEMELYVGSSGLLYNLQLATFS
ncbi:uncharacterized protein PV06_11564 [Exophiala oligosperma]|uniref:Uncharacterized protein n=1 Tax=Exophiala oligosperma TaxID=215243 RepID=A0A0D2CYL0_9EURO|nr:uncharacterized protein PV06_11564 [Exophiala oligosperma]KIW36138.1 hypothetical protein PV06_11564 [Exophiala oligosperma]